MTEPIDRSEHRARPGRSRRAFGPGRSKHALGGETDHLDESGAPGFVHTTNREGNPVVRGGTHRPVAEVVCALHAPSRAPGQQRFTPHHAVRWEYVRPYPLDREHGSRYHRLDASHRPKER